MTSSYMSNLLESVTVELPLEQPIKFCKDDSMSSHSFNIGGNLFQNPDMGVTAIVSLKILEEASEGFGKHHKLFSEYTKRLAKYPVDLVLILFDIAHGTELYVPNKTLISIKVPELKKDSVPELCDLIGRAENLGLGHLLGPYLEHWMPAQYKKSNIKASVADAAAWLAWKIGAGHLYGDMIDHLAFICTLDSLGNVIRPESSGESLVEQGIHDRHKDNAEVPANVASARKEMLEEVIGELRLAVSLGNSGCVANNMNVLEDERDRCTNAIHDYMTEESKWKISKELDVDGLSQVCLGESISTYRGSIKELRQRLLALKCEAAHEACDPFGEMRDKFERELSWPLFKLDSKRQEQFTEQAKAFKWTLG